MASIVAVSSLTFGFLFLLRSLTAWTEETKGTREHLASDTFNDCDNVASVERFLLLWIKLVMSPREKKRGAHIVDFFLLNK
jgi:hypothetical protein